MAKAEEKSYTQYAVVVKGDMGLLVEEVNNLLTRGMLSVVSQFYRTVQRYFITKQLLSSRTYL